MFQGLRTVVYGVPDIEPAKAWYQRVLGAAPYFDQPFYVGFNVGGYELGLDPDATPGTGSSNGPITYWGVPDAAAAFRRLVELGAREITAVHDVGDGIHLAAVCDPFGNVLGVIENPHFGLLQSQGD